MITVAKAPPGRLNSGSHGRPCYTRIRVIMRRVIRRADCITKSDRARSHALASSSIARASAALYIRRRAAAVLTKTENFALQNFKLAMLKILKWEAMPIYRII